MVNGEERRRIRESAAMGGEREPSGIITPGIWIVGSIVVYLTDWFINFYGISFTNVLNSFLSLGEGITKFIFFITFIAIIIYLLTREGLSRTEEFWSSFFLAFVIGSIFIFGWYLKGIYHILFIVALYFGAARPVAKAMAKSKLLTMIVKPFVSAWAYNMAYKMGVVEEKGGYGDHMRFHNEVECRRMYQNEMDLIFTEPYEDAKARLDSVNEKLEKEMNDIVDYGGGERPYAGLPFPFKPGQTL